MKNKKFAVILTAFLLALTGCSDKGDSAESSSKAVLETPPPTETEAFEPTFPEQETPADPNAEFVFDDAKVLTEKDSAEIYNNTAYISRTFKINCAVVTAAKLNGKSPTDYAEEYYKKLFGGSNGVMFLINNETGNDVILRKGAPAHFITNGDVTAIFNKISPLLVTEKYAEAVNRTLTVFAEKLPQFAVDRTNKMAKEEITAVNETLAAASGDSGTLSMIFIGTSGKQTVEEYAKAHYAKYYALSNGGDALMVVNCETAEYCLCAPTLPESEKGQAAMKEGMTACLTAADGKTSFNCQKAAEIFVKFMGK